MAARVLFVDDDENILASYRRQLRKQYEITTATSGAEALEKIAQGPPFEVLISDMRMPQMDGVQLLAEARKRTPDTVRVMLTGNADVQTAVDAVNQGAAFRFLCKPCPPEEIAKAIDAATEQYRLARAEKEVLQETLAASVKVMGELLSLANPSAFYRAARLADLMRRVAANLGLESTWEFELAGRLSQIGCLTIPGEILEKVQAGKVLSPDEQGLFEKHPEVGRDLVENIPRLAEVAEIIGLQERRMDENGMSLDLKEDKPIPLGARALHVVMDFDMLVTSGKGRPEALAEVKRSSDWYDPDCLAALEKAVLEEAEYETIEVPIRDLQPGMIFEENIRTEDGRTLKTVRGLEVTVSLKAWLRNAPATMRIREPIKVCQVVDREAAKR